MSENREHTFTNGVMPREGGEFDIEVHKNLLQTQEDLNSYLLNEKNFKRKMSYAKKVSIILFSTCSALYVGPQFIGSNVLMCIIVIFVIGIFAGSLFWSMWWYFLYESKKELYDVFQDPESFEGILLFLACIASILHVIILRVVLFKQFGEIAHIASVRARISPPAGIAFVEFFLFVLIFCGIIKFCLRKISYHV